VPAYRVHSKLLHALNWLDLANGWRLGGT